LLERLVEQLIKGYDEEEVEEIWKELDSWVFEEFKS
jgi:hypothetical protein